MLHNVVSHINGVGLYGAISITIFFTVFAVALVWALRLKKTYVVTMRELPLEDGTRPTADAHSHSRHE